MVRSVLFLKRDGFDFFSRAIPSIVSFQFMPEMVRDLDVIDRLKLMQGISAWIDEKKILPSTVLIVVADQVLFSKEVPAASSTLLPPKEHPVLASAQGVPNQEAPLDEKQSNATSIPGNTSHLKAPLNIESIVESYKATIPFENVAATVVTSQTGKKIYATNEDLLTTIKQAFTEKNSVIEIAVPFALLGTTVEQQLSDTNAMIALQKYDQLRQNSLLVQKQNPELKLTVHAETSASHTREIILVVVFCALLLVFGFLLFKRLSAPPSKSKLLLLEQTNTRVNPTIAPSPTPSVVTASPSGQLVGTVTPAKPASSSGELK